MRSAGRGPQISAIADIPLSQIDLYDPATLLDPYPAYAALRELGPVVRLERYGVWAMARHQPVADALQDWRTFSSDAGVGVADSRKEQPWRTKSIVLEVDPPYHDKTRSVLARVLSPAAVRRLRQSSSSDGKRTGFADWAPAAKPNSASSPRSRNR